jgi:DNA invertase Pin-like site-specific DNA recombinase
MSKGQTVGYVRVSTADQNTGRQLDGLQLDKVFTDSCSGKAHQPTTVPGDARPRP